MAATRKAHRQGWEGKPDPMEAIIERWLIERGVPFTRDHPSRLDFYPPGLQLFIECKRFYTPRVNDQLERVRGNNVIVVQGIDAWDQMQLLLGDGGCACPNRPRPRDWISAYETHAVADAQHRAQTDQHVMNPSTIATGKPAQ